MNLIKITKWKTVGSLAAAVLLAAACSASAAVLLTDNFNVVSGNSQDVNQDLAVRQAGPLALATYTGLNVHHQVGNTGTDVGQPGGASNSGYVLLALNGNFQSDLDIASVSAGVLTIEVDMYNNGSNPGGGGSGQWVAFALRREGQTFPVAGGGEFGFLKRANGGVQVFQNGGSINPGSWDTAGFATADHWTLTFSDTAGTGSAFVGNGSKVTFMNGATTLGTITLSQLNRSGLKLGFTQDNNRFAGIDNLTISGTLPATKVTTANQSGGNPFTPSWTAEAPNLIAGLSPTTTIGDFTKDGAGGTPVLTDGTIGSSGSIGGFATCGAGGGSGNTLIYTLTNVVNGSDVTNIVVYSGWGDGGRDGQYYDVSYSTIAAPSTYVRIATVFYLPGFGGGSPANRVSIAKTNGTPLGSGIANIKFDFSSPPQASSFNNAYQGYSEIIVQGSDTAAPPPPPSPFLTEDTLPTYIDTVAGDQVVFTAAYSNAPPANVQWQVISGGATNNISGATSGTLTLNNVQLADSGFYRLKAVNATNGAAAPSYSAARQLVVSAVPAAVNGIIIEGATQRGAAGSGLSTNFYPTWNFTTNNDLILGFVLDGTGATPGTFLPGAGNFANWGTTSSDPSVVNDGSFGYLTSWPGIGTSPTESSLGNDGSGASLTYTLDYLVAATNGYDITNITVYGGWGDGGRDAQQYEVLYSSPLAPDTFNHLVTVNYNPGGVPSDTQSATRSILIPSGTALVQNVAKIKFSYSTAGPENGSVGVSEIQVFGKASAPIPILLTNPAPATLVTVVGDNTSLTATFNGATGFQWQKDGVNLSNGGGISGATTPTLTLSNLQLSNTATNSGYRLLASNSTGTTASGPVAIIVNNPIVTNNVVTSISSQLQPGDDFIPTWTVNTSFDLILGATPSANGNFNMESQAGNRDVSTLTAGGSLEIQLMSGVNRTTSANYVTVGNGAGSTVIYTLATSGNGIDLTNVTIYGGWADDGRDQQGYTVEYSTIQNPGNFLPIATVDYNPNNPGHQLSVSRIALTPATGVLAKNVGLVKIDFTWPRVENSYVGCAAITIGGKASVTTETGPVITTQNELSTFDWTVETPNLIANKLPTTSGSGVFTEEGCNVTNLTDGVIGFGNLFGASCGNDGIAVPYIIFNAAQGWNLTNIVVYSLWHDYGRDGQFYNLSYSTLSAPSTFLPLASVSYNPDVPQNGVASGNRVTITPAIGQTMLASNVYAVKFDFTSQGIQDYAWSGYSEIVLQGSSLTSATPPTISSATLNGGNLILQATGGTPNYGYTVLSSTNLLTPLANWTVSASGVTDGAGSISNAIPASAVGNSFFRVRMP